MIVEFSVANFRSIKSKQRLSLMAAPIVSKDPSVDKNNVIVTSSGMKLLKSVAIYGANASGKSNLIKAMMAMMIFIDKSFQNDNEIKRLEPFALDKRYAQEPIHFELVFQIKGGQYRYGFEVTGEKVSAEWLFGPAKKNEVEYFTRSYDLISVNKSRFQEGVDLTEGKTRDSTLFLNVVYAFNGKIASEIREFLRYSIIITTGINDMLIRDITMNMLDLPDMRAKVLELLKKADFGIEEISKVDASALEFLGPVPPKIKKKLEEGEKYHVLASSRQIRNAIEGDLPTVFDFDRFESEGTKKFFTYAGPIIDSLQQGKILVIDEFDARLHPALSRRIVEMFNSNEINTHDGQLIFVTHDINLLDSSLLRRDQIYFAEKDLAGETSLYSLINVGGVRNDASYEKDYIKGKYGAVPFLGNFKI